MCSRRRVRIAARHVGQYEGEERAQLSLCEIVFAPQCKVCNAETMHKRMETMMSPDGAVFRARMRMRMWS